jgi:UDP-glucose 4-epimerase
MKVLITGGGGFLGSHLGDAHLAKGDEVYALDLANTKKISHNMETPRFHYVKDSILDFDMLETLIIKSDLIYHLAGVVGVEHYVEDPFRVLDTNINGTQNVFKLALRHNKKVVYASTSEVYGRNPKVPWDEYDDRVLGSTTIDRWCYSTSKAAGEHFGFAYKKLGLRITTVRYFNIYGPRLDLLDKGRVVTIFLGQLLKNKPVTIIGNGMQTRCFTYITDCVEATMRAGSMPEADGEIFNLGTDVETSIKDLAILMKELSGSQSEIRFVNQEEIYGKSYEDIPRRVPRVERMKSILKFEATTPLREGLKTTIDWFRKELSN